MTHRPPVEGRDPPYLRVLAARSHAGAVGHAHEGRAGQASPQLGADAFAEPGDPLGAVGAGRRPHGPRGRAARRGPGSATPARTRLPLAAPLGIFGDERGALVVARIEGPRLGAGRKWDVARHERTAGRGLGGAEPGVGGGGRGPGAGVVDRDGARPGPLRGAQRDARARGAHHGQSAGRTREAQVDQRGVHPEHRELERGVADS
jgi:hypothetical protein